MQKCQTNQNQSCAVPFSKLSNMCHGKWHHTPTKFCTLIFRFHTPLKDNWMVSFNSIVHIILSLILTATNLRQASTQSLLSNFLINSHRLPTPYIQKNHPKAPIQEPDSSGIENWKNHWPWQSQCEQAPRESMEIVTAALFTPPKRRTFLTTSKWQRQLTKGRTFIPLKALELLRWMHMSSYGTIFRAIFGTIFGER